MERVTEALGRRVSAAREATEARGETFYPGPSRIHLAAYPPALGSTCGDESGVGATVEVTVEPSAEPARPLFAIESTSATSRIPAMIMTPTVRSRQPSATAAMPASA